MKQNAAESNTTSWSSRKTSFFLVGEECSSYLNCLVSPAFTNILAIDAKESDLTVSPLTLLPEYIILTEANLIQVSSEAVFILPWRCQRSQDTQLTPLASFDLVQTLWPSGRKVKNPPANVGEARDAGSIPGSERSPGIGNGNPLQYSWLENSIDREAWWAIVHEVTKKELDTTEQLSTHSEWGCKLPRYLGVGW